MAGVKNQPSAAVRVWLALFCLTAILGGSFVHSQAPPESPQPSADGAPMVVELRISGNQYFPVEKIVRHIHTRANRPFDQDMVEEDVRRLSNTRMFLDVKVSTQQAPGGVIVIFEVRDRPVMQYVKFIGPEGGLGGVKKKVLAKEISMKAYDPMDPYAVTEGRRKIEEFYHSKGFSKVHVSIFEGDKPGDKGVIYIIDEGPKQRVLWTGFEGNTFASDGRLRTQIKAKPGFFWVFGTLDRKEVDEDINRLTAYYRSMGFFQAKVGRELHFNEAGTWLSLTYVIQEGPRYKVRDVKVLGNRKIDTTELAKDLKLSAGKDFNQNEMTADVLRMQDMYGAIGYVFADVKADPRFLEEPGMLDLVYNIREGNQYRVGRIDPRIKGENPHTRISTVLNRLSIYPGQIVDTRELRASERRLKGSQLFENNPMTGNTPKISFTRPELEKEKDETEIAEQPRRPNGWRGQSPDPVDDKVPPQRGAIVAQSVPACEAPQVEPAVQPAVEFTVEEPREVLWFVDCHYSPWRDEPESAEVFATSLPLVPVEEPEARAPIHEVAPPSCHETVPAQFVPADDEPMIIRGQSPGAEDGSRQGGWQPVSSIASASDSDRAAWDRQPLPQPSRTGNKNLPWSAPRRSDSEVKQAQYVASPVGASSAVAPEPTYGSAPQQGYPSTGMAPVRTTPSFSQPNVYRDQNGGYNANDGYVVPTLDPAASTARQTSPLLNTPAPPRSFTGGAGYSGGIAPPNDSPFAGAPAAPANGGLLPGPGDPLAPPPLMPGSNPIADGTGPLFGGPLDENPTLPLDLRPEVVETMTGKLMLGVSVNSDLGLVGSVVVDEQNFDWTRWPRSWDEILRGQAFRGNGQRFRFEAMPGTELQRYTVQFTDPYLLDTNISETLSAFYYDRRYTEWTERRAGTKVIYGYQFIPDLWGSVSYRFEDVHISHPITPRGVLPELDEVLGSNTLHGLGVKLTHDTRDNAFLPTEGHFVEVGFEQVLGAFTYPRAEIDARKYFLVKQHPDGTGRHVLSLNSRMAVSGSDTPIYEHFYAGGFSTLRGFEFRGVSPRTAGVAVGGEFSLLNSMEYLFPITADDMVRGVVFVDSGTIQPEISDWSQRYRVSPGFGLRFTIPAMGPAPIALDFAFPVVKQPGDHTQVFSFFVGWMR